ncbi:MAG: transcription termination/antitermination protein NusA [Deferribacteres bacterium]|nr:transcription termination/antitermination protein NusA [Deferribacteres bacterium]
MKGKELLYTIELLEQQKGIPKEAIIELLEESILSALKKRLGEDLDIEVRLDVETGDFNVFQLKKVVKDGEVKDRNKEIALSDAKKIDPEVEEGDVIRVPFAIEGMGRIAARATMQALTQKLTQLERDIIYNTFKKKEGDIVQGTVLREERGNIIVDLMGKAEGILPPREQVKNERYRKGDTMKFYVLEVRRGRGGEPRIILSRTHPRLLERLFEKEMPEVVAGLVSVKSVARDPGERAKVAVAANDPEIDPVGACIGVRGARIQGIVRELHGENIDVVLYSDDPKEFIANALKPARVRKIIIDEENKEAKVIVDDDQFSLALGRRGQNVRLAAKLTGWKIDIKTVSEYGLSELEEGED